VVVAGLLYNPAGRRLVEVECECLILPVVFRLKMLAGIEIGVPSNVGGDCDPF